MNRRELVIAGVSGAATLTCTFPALSAGTPAPFAVVIDRRFAAAREYGRAAAWRGHRIFGYHGDLTATWLHDIEPRWSQRAGPLAGMTTPAALFCLEQLAAQHWLRTVTRTEHRGPEQELVSWVIA